MYWGFPQFRPRFCAYVGLGAGSCLETLGFLDLDSLCALGGGEDAAMAHNIPLSSPDSGRTSTGG